MPFIRDISSNQFSGAISSSIGNLTLMQSLYVSYTRYL